MDRSEFIEEVGPMVKKIKATKKLPGVTDIFAPGEKEAQLLRQYTESGEIEIEDNLLEGLRLAAK